MLQSYTKFLTLPHLHSQNLCKTSFRTLIKPQNCRAIFEFFAHILGGQVIVFKSIGLFCVNSMLNIAIYLKLFSF